MKKPLDIVLVLSEEDCSSEDSEKIVWPEQWSEEDTELDLPVFLCTVDGTHCRIQEPYHPLYCKDTAYYSHKSKKAGLNYEVQFQFLKTELFRSVAPFQPTSMT
jgi:hypothetical protein